MNIKTLKLIIGVYVAISISICGHFYINPTITKGPPVKYGTSSPIIDYSNFKSSIIFFVVGLIVIYSILQFFLKKNENPDR